MENEDLPRPFGPYTLLDGLGRGGMGQVYLALRDGLAGVTQLSVIKTLRTQHASDAEYISRFEDEAKTVVQLSHRNIAQVFDVGIIDGTYYMAMELVRGVDLDTLNKRAASSGGLPPGEGVYIIAEALEALGYAHRFKDPLTGDPLNIVHRDVSPHNVMVSHEGEVKLIDFGLSASTLKKTETAPQVVMGKLLYMAPEQARDDPLDGRCDVYAIGIMLAEVLSGRRYYEGMSAQAVWSHVGTGFRSPVLDELPPAFAEICRRATHPDVNRRYASADAFRTELLSAAREQGWHSGSTELRGTLGKLLHVEEETFRKRVRDAVNKSAESAPAQDATVVTQQMTKVTTIASALGSALSSTSSGDVAPSDSGPSSGIFAPMSAPGSRAPRLADAPSRSHADVPSPQVASSGSPVSPSAAPRAEALHVPEPRTGDTAILAIGDLDTGGGPVASLPPNAATERQHVAPASPPEQTARIDRVNVAAPQRASAGRVPWLVGAGVVTLLLGVVAVLAVRVVDEDTLPVGPTSTAGDDAPALEQAPEPTEAEPTEAEPTEAEPTEAEPTEAEPTEPEAAGAEPEPAAHDAPAPEPAATAPDPTGEPGAETGPEAEAVRTHTGSASEVEPSDDRRRTRKRKAASTRRPPKKKSVKKVQHKRPSVAKPTTNSLPELMAHLRKHCQHAPCSKPALVNAGRKVGDIASIKQSRRMLKQCIDRCHRP